MSVNAKPKTSVILVIVGTRKGAFIFSSDANRKKWDMSGPHWAGSDVFHAIFDDRGDGRLWVVRNDPVFGSEVHRSDDLGATWHSSKIGPQITSDPTIKVNRLWHVTPHPTDTDVVYLGAEPASLFKSEDAGETWTEIDGITKHPSRNGWMEGFGGMCLHSIIPDADSPERMLVGISAAGVFSTVDGGATWAPLNRGVRADFMGEPYPEVGQCPHSFVSHPANPQRLYQQNHCGVYRSDEGGNQWIDISDGLPSRFGLPMTVHPYEQDTIYVLPEDKAIGEDLGGGQRYVTDAKFRVFRSRNAGKDWEPLTNGLPQKNAYLHAMRDQLDPCGVYVGTSTGQLFHSSDEGDNWDLLADYLPPINSVETAVKD